MLSIVIHKMAEL